MDTTSISTLGDGESVRMNSLAVTGRDEDGNPTPTVRELAAILQAIPERYQDLPVTVAGDEAIFNIGHARLLTDHIKMTLCPATGK